MRHTLQIPSWHPPLANQWVGRHWGVKHKLRQQATDVLWAYALQAGIPKATGPRRVQVTITGWAHGGVFPDEDAVDKLLLDALVNAHLLLDDSARGLVGRMQVKYERGERGTVIVLEDAVPAPTSGRA